MKKHPLGGGTWMVAAALLGGLLSVPRSAAQPPDVYRACCFRDGTCLVLLVSECEADGGIPQAVESCDAVFCQPFKWYQPPVPAEPPNTYLGWDQESTVHDGALIVADDWVSNGQPVVGVRWWGSFRGWTYPHPPPQPALPYHFHISFWTDVPTSTGEPFSHPGRCLHLVGPPYEWNYSVEFYGWEYDPRSRQWLACFQFEQHFAESDWFIPPAEGPFWVSISACYNCLPPPPDTPVFGWLTRPRDLASPAADDAVVMFTPVIPWEGATWTSGWPIEYPAGRSWDAAFELLMPGPMFTKWYQSPDLAPTGLDVNASAPSMLPGVAYLLADDFLCWSTGPLRQITIWGSWFHDMLPDGQNPANVQFSLSIHDSSAANQPGGLLWQQTFAPGEFAVEPVPVVVHEGWLTPPTGYEPLGDTMCWRYTFDLGADAFVQQGTPENPILYWLDVQATPVATVTPAFFGWKTTLDHWGHDAVWNTGIDPPPTAWSDLVYPAEHPYAGQSIDLAFRLVGQAAPVVFWSQLPERYIPSDGFNGWDQYSVYGQELVADDWFCNNSQPVTDIHWWGSFLDWLSPEAPAVMPDGFWITIWTDVPAGSTGEFSHPGVCVWSNFCDSYTHQFVGWDFDPRVPMDSPYDPPEATFLFTQALPREQWFYQAPGENIYWLSIAAVYLAGPQAEYPFGWKTRPHVTEWPPDAALVIYDPAAPEVGSEYVGGWPLIYANGWWDMAFELTTLPPGDIVVCEPQPPNHPPEYWYRVTPNLGAGRCDFHVRVYDPHPDHYAPGPLPVGWQFAVHRVDAEWWASWWNPDCTNPIYTSVTFSFSNPNPSVWGDWVTTMAGTDNPYSQAMDQASQHATEPDGYGYRVHVPVYQEPTQACCLPDSTCVPAVPFHCIAVLQGYPLGPDTSCLTVICPLAKWSQPPTPSPEAPASTFYGWNDVSNYWFRVVADDWACNTWRPLTDVHWWGSYIGWDAVEPPAGAPTAFHIGLWTNVPGGPGGPGDPFSHPGAMFQEWFVPRGELHETSVGIDFHPEYGYETCFQYDFQIQRPRWFWQPLWGEIFWVSISAVYGTACNGDFDGDGDVDSRDQNAFMQCLLMPPQPRCWQADMNGDGIVDLNDLPIMQCQLNAGWPDPACCIDHPTIDPVHPWGWKTRQPAWNDDAVRIFAPLPPRNHEGWEYQFGEPIFNAEGSWDMAFVLTTMQPGVCPGDCNCDGRVNFGDIDYFVAAIPDNETAWAALYATRHGGLPPPCSFENCDITGDGHVNFSDIDPFVALIPSVCPPLTQACCFWMDGCRDLMAADCEAQGGQPMGPYTWCATIECPLPTK